jgi:hypothetical protein
MRLVGRARDVMTPKSGDSLVVCAEDGFTALLTPHRTIVAIEAEPARPALSRLVGGRGGGGLRRLIEEVVPEERRNATPLYLILDDISGSSLVAGWAWSQWDTDWLTAAARAAMKDVDLERAIRSREGLCIGFAPDSSAFNPGADRSGTRAPDLRHPEDPQGWHTFAVQNGSVGLRRARRIDVSLDEVIIVDSAFQDSATTPDGGRAVVHEYRLSMTADPRSLRMLSVKAEPRVLPFVECPSAVDNITRLLDMPLPELREKVLAELRGIAGCTHLNDALRALADVPALMNYLSGADAASATFLREEPTPSLIAIPRRLAD